MCRNERHTDTRQRSHENERSFAHDPQALVILISMSTPLLSPPSVCQDYVSAFTIASARELIGKSSLLRNHMMSSLRYDRQSFNQGGHPKEKRARVITLALRLNDICSRFGAAPRVVLPPIRKTKRS